MLKRIEYISCFATPLSGDDIDRIAEFSQKKNAKNDLTGALVVSGGYFFHVVEGPPKAVDSLWASLLRDPRHDGILLVKSEEGDIERIFPTEWKLKMIDLDRDACEGSEPLKAVLKEIARGSARVRRLVDVLERVAWAEMIDAS